ncbi:hypothetical protein [Micromonospora aurantiaca (nom. illeg.)]|uniref:hypothetical protein n=1 Tax=Micromonospora aurantiaca (nom. illeg.) TaxID=47850 RepID=UPI003EC10099
MADPGTSSSIGDHMTSTIDGDRNPTETTRFFTHNPPRERQQAPMSPTTRYLCGAAYRSERFADGVIAELIDDGHRAVVPTIGYDLEPILRHCYHARHLWLLQNALVSAILLVGFFAATWSTVLLAGIAFLANFLSPPAERADRSTAYLVLGGLALAALVWTIGPPLLVLLGLSSGTPPDTSAPSELTTSYWPVLWWLIGLGLSVLAVVALARATVLRIFTRDLAPGARHEPPEVTNPAILRRMKTVAIAQHGNVVLHSGYDPFLGSGHVVRAWSVAMELKRDRGPDGHRPTVTGPVAVDPVALNRHVKRRLAALGSVELPAHERMTGLVLRDQVVASGAQWRNYPLIDAGGRQPFSHASPQAVEAIIRAPQPSVRHFLRASVGADIREATGNAGDVIMPAEYQNVVVSTFTHIAVEGGMLYVESVSTVLGPIREKFLDLDQHVASDGTWWEPFREALRLFGAAILTAPVRLVRTVVRAIGANRRMTRADRETEQLPRYDFGARAEVRQLASASRPVTYLQRLDAEKYSKLMERRVSEAVLGYLADQGIDTSEYETRMNVFNNHGVFIRGDNHGPAAAGPGATALLDNGGGKRKAKSNDAGGR